MLHCPKNNLNLVHIKNKPVTTGAVATVYVWFLCAFIWHRNPNMLYP